MSPDSQRYILWPGRYLHNGFIRYHFRTDPVTQGLGKRVNLFLSALLFAYCIRSYIIFTSSLFENEVHKRPGIYLIIFFSFLVLVSSIFPKIDKKKMLALSSRHIDSY